MAVEIEIIPSSITGPNPTSEIFIPRTYESQDFQKLYEQEYYSHQETKRKLQAAYDKIEYWEQRIEKLEADNAYLRKLLFGKKAEKRAAAGLGPAIAEAGPKSGKHGAQEGHAEHGRKIPFHLKLWQDHVHRLAEEDCYCPLCGMELENTGRRTKEFLRHSFAIVPQKLRPFFIPSSQLGKRHGVNLRKFLKRYLAACIQNRSAPLQDSVLESFLPHRYAKLYPEDLV